MGSQFNVELLINNSLSHKSSLPYADYVENPKIPTNLSDYFPLGELQV
jgi:hypothetical protein